MRARGALHNDGGLTLGGSPRRQWLWRCRYRGPRQRCRPTSRQHIGAPLTWRPSLPELENRVLTLGYAMVPFSFDPTRRTTTDRQRSHPYTHTPMERVCERCAASGLKQWPQPLLHRPAAMICAADALPNLHTTFQRASAVAPANCLSWKNAPRSAWQYVVPAGRSRVAGAARQRHVLADGSRLAGARRPSTRCSC